MSKLAALPLTFVLCLSPGVAKADSGHLHSAIPVLETLIDKPGNTTMLGELRFLSGAIENSPQNRQVKAALMSVLACGRLRAGLYEEGLAMCRRIQSSYGDTDFGRLVAPARFEEPGQPQKISVQQVERQYKQILDSALALVVKTVRQGKVAEVRVKARVTKSAFRKPGEEGPEPKSFVPASLAEQVEDAAAYPILGRSKANLFDGLVYVCRRKKLDLSIDPEILPALAGLQADLPMLAALEDITALDALLSSHSLLLAKTEVAQGRQTIFITSPSVWRYSSACGLLQSGDLAGAYRILSEDAADMSEFAEHAAAFKEILVTTVRTRKTLNTLERDMRSALDAYSRAKAAAGSSRQASGLERADGSAPIVSGGAARQSLQRTLKQVEEVKLEFENAARSIGENNLTVVERFNECFESRLYAEASYILEYLVDVRRSVNEMVQAFGAHKFKSNITWSAKDDVPEEIQGARTMLKDAVKTATARVEAARSILDSNPVKAAEQFGAAFQRDRVNIAARAGVGYCAIRQHAVALTEVCDRNWADDKLATALAGENRSRRKDGFLRALNFVTYGGTPLPTDTTPPEKQVAVGAALAATPGAILPLTIRLESRRRSMRPRPRGQKDQYWKNLRLAQIDEKELLAEGITFGDQERKDPRLLAAAQDMLKWLKWTHEKVMRNKGVHIEFTRSDGPVPDDSLGLPAALGGYSCVSNAPLRPDLASAGALQPDGSLRASGGAYHGVAGAVQADRIEILLMPRAAEFNLLLVPVDYLCRMVIITDDQIGTSAKYAFDKEYHRETMTSLREAQTLTLLGQYEAARPTLQKIAARHPEIYTARRLLELMALHQRN